MSEFIRNKITDSRDIIGAELKQARQEKGLGLNEISKELGIQSGYLKALEEGEYEKLPQGVYGKNFLRIYAGFLGRDPAKIAKVFDEHNEQKKNRLKSDIFSVKRPRAYLFLAVPRLIRNFFLVLMALICLSYLGYYINNVISPPKLSVVSPRGDITQKESIIRVAGQTEKKAEVKINGETVLTDQDGRFYKEISLHFGLNTINIEAKKAYSRQSTAQIKVLVEE